MWVMRYCGLLKRHLPYRAMHVTRTIALILLHAPIQSPVRSLLEKKNVGRLAHDVWEMRETVNALKKISFTIVLAMRAVIIKVTW